jgi:hypothetical protein
MKIVEAVPASRKAAFDLQDALLLIGVTSIVGGIALWSRAAAAVVFGVFCLIAVLQIERGKRAGKDVSGTSQQ